MCEGTDALMNCDNCMCKPPCETGWLVLPSYNRSYCPEMRCQSFQPPILLNLEDTSGSVHFVLSLKSPHA